MTLDESLTRYRRGLMRGKRRKALLHTLAGKNLACWCKLPAPGQPDRCHAAILLQLANRAAPSRDMICEAA